MRILHVSNFVQKHDGRLYWNFPFRVNNGLTRLGHNVLNFSDRDIARENVFRSSSLGISKMNHRLIKTVINYKPHLIILGHADMVSNETLSKIKKIQPKCKIILWNIDHLLMNNTIKKIKERSPYISNTFITTGDTCISKAAINGMKITFIPNIFDKSIDEMKIFENNSFEYDVFFAMSHGVGSGILKKGKTDGREKLLFKITQNKNIKENFYGFNNIEPIWASNLNVEMNKSLMGINLNSGKSMYLYSSDRISTYIGNGLLTFISESYGFHDLYKKNEVIFYKDDDDLMNKIIYYKKNIDEAKSIAINGWKASHTKYNSKIICDFIINKTFDKSINSYYWPNISYV